MPDREKVVRGLEHCVGEEHANCENCPYLMDVVGVGCYTRLNRDALALLNEQEARVLEYSEIAEHPLVWLEDNDKEDVIPALFLQYNGWNAEFAVQAPDEDVDTIVRSQIVIAVERMYGITWRAWTSRPNEQVRRDTPWES